MKSGEKNPVKELYNQLRRLSWEQLWSVEVARFDRATAQERMARVAVIRAVGVVFSESGPAEQRESVKQWLLGLLHDPSEKVRRYAMTALPKIGTGASGEPRSGKRNSSGAPWTRSAGSPRCKRWNADSSRRRSRR